MHAENCAESATTVRPQVRHTRTSIIGWRPNSPPTSRAHAPLIIREAMVSFVRPHLSASWPATRLPKPPAAITPNAARLAHGAATPALLKLARRNSGSHAH